MLHDEVFMREALLEAQKSFQQNEVPVGAVVVYKGEIISRAHNCVESLRDATAHAEVLALRAASAHLNNWRLSETTLYCTLEPCSLCAGALLLSRVSTLVWGAADKRHGAHGSWVNLLDCTHPTHQIIVRQGVLSEECACLMTDFFRKRRIRA